MRDLSMDRGTTVSLPPSFTRHTGLAELRAICRTASGDFFRPSEALTGERRLEEAENRVLGR
jgi:hypothetical protein